MSNSILSALGSSSSRLSFAVLCAVLVSASASADRIVQYTGIVRYGEAGGVGAIRNANLVVAVESLTGQTVSATRANGSSTWDDFFATSVRKQFFLFNNTASSDAEFLNWEQTNQVGNWQYSFDYGDGNGASSYNWDSTPHYVAESSRTYLALTASSASLVEQIRSQGLTGTFTFNLAESVTGVYSFAADVSFGGQYVELFNGASGPISSFTMTFNQPISTTAKMLLSYHGTVPESIISETGGMFGGPITVEHGYFADTVYGAAPVPAPGAIALFGIAGLAGRRRRR